MDFRKCAALAGVLFVLCGLCACRNGGAEESRTEDVSATDSAGTEWLDVCQADARGVMRELDRDAAFDTVIFARREDADLEAAMKSGTYADAIAALATAMKACDAESICVYAFCETDITFVYDSRYGEKEDYFTSYSLRRETWEESDFAEDRESLLFGKECGYTSLAGSGKTRYTALAHWFTSDDGTVFYVAVTKLR